MSLAVPLTTRTMKRNPLSVTVAVCLICQIPVWVHKNVSVICQLDLYQLMVDHHRDVWQSVNKSRPAEKLQVHRNEFLIDQCDLWQMMMDLCACRQSASRKFHVVRLLVRRNGFLNGPGHV